MNYVNPIKGVYPNMKKTKNWDKKTLKTYPNLVIF